jgi:hypothetical protein
MIKFMSSDSLQEFAQFHMSGRNRIHSTSINDIERSSLTTDESMNISMEISYGDRGSICQVFNKVRNFAF